MDNQVGAVVPRIATYAEVVQAVLRRTEQLSFLRSEDAILLFGSYARSEQRSDSDVDLLIIGSAAMRASVHQWPEAVADILVEDQHTVRAKLKRFDEWNNSFMLNVLSDAVVLRDPGGVAAELIEEARTLRLSGPPAFTSTDAMKAIHNISVMLRSAKAHGRNYWSLSREHLVLRRMRLDQVVNRAVYLYYKSQGRWTSSFPRLVSRLKVEQPELYSRWTQYVNSDPWNSHLAAAEIVRYCIDSISVKYGTI